MENVNQELEYKALQMLPAREKDVYQEVVPSEQINRKWDFMYFIEMMDKNGNDRIYPDLNKETPYLITRLIR